MYDISSSPYQRYAKQAIQLFLCYSIIFDNELLCTTTTPLGKYEYNCLTIGVYIAPDIF